MLVLPQKQVNLPNNGTEADFLYITIRCSTILKLRDEADFNNGLDIIFKVSF